MPKLRVEAGLLDGFVAGVVAAAEAEVAVDMSDESVLLGAITDWDITLADGIEMGRDEEKSPEKRLASEEK